MTVELPDNEAATAVALAVNGSGGATVKTIALLSPEDVDAAAKISADYRPPATCGSSPPFDRDPVKPPDQTTMKLVVYSIWRQVSEKDPIRPDGEPNRPLTIFTVAIETR